MAEDDQIAAIRAVIEPRYELREDQQVWELIVEDVTGARWKPVAKLSDLLASRAALDACQGALTQLRKAVLTYSTLPDERWSNDQVAGLAKAHADDSQKCATSHIAQIS